MVDRVHMNVPLFHTSIGKYHLIQDCHTVVSEMIQDRVEGILLLERTGRIFLPILRAIYRKKGLPFPIWRTFDPGPNPYGHSLENNQNLELIRKNFEKIGKIGVFDEYMVSGIRLKNTVLQLSKELQHPVHGYVLQNQHGSENPDIRLDVFSAGSKRS